MGLYAESKAPSATGSGGNGAGLINKPPEFDGTESSYITFKRTANLYLLFHSSAPQLQSNDQRIIFLLTFFLSGNTASFAQHVVAEALQTKTFGTLDKFWERCDEAFLDPQQQEKAHDELLALQQGHMLAYEYFLHFDQICNCARYEDTAVHERVLKCVMRNGLARSLMLEVHKALPVNSSLDQEWSKAIEIDNSM